MTALATERNPKESLPTFHCSPFPIQQQKSHNVGTMKRNRKTSGKKDTAKAVDPVANTKQPKQNHTLEEVRAKLEQARLKKLAAEERLLRQKQQQNSVGQPTNSSATSNPTNIAKQKSRAQEAQEALGRARSRFRTAQQQQYSTGGNPAQNYSDHTKPWNRNKRQYYGSQTPYQSSLPPISALSSTFSLKITNIADSGPPEIVHHYPDSVHSPWSSIGPIGSRAALIEALGGTKAVEALQLAREDGEDVSTLRKKTANGKTNKKNAKKKASASLLQRKTQLQNELLALKEKLEMKSSQEKQKDQASRNTMDATDAKNDEGNKDRKLPSTKEDLERRKAEAQTVMDISYWKHFVSKQEHLLEQVTTKINNMDKSNDKGGAYKECLEKRHSTNKAITKVQQDLNVLEQRQALVEDGIVTSTQQLLDARQELHQAKTLREASRNRPTMAEKSRLL